MSYQTTTIQAERDRVSEIHRLGAKYGVDENTVNRHVESGKPLEDFQQVLLRSMKSEPIESYRPEPLGLSSREAGQYSLQRAITSIVEHGKLDGLEKESSDALSKKIGRQAKGFFMPLADLTVSRSAGFVSRGMSAGIASAGGNMVATDTYGELMIEKLRNKTVLGEMGVRQLDGLRGNVAIPKHDGGSTAYWLAEGAEVESSAPIVGSVNLSPHRLASHTSFTKQLLAQSSTDLEAFIREDLIRSISLAEDLAGLAGSGDNGQPLGIMNTTGVNTVSFGGAPTWAKIVEMESLVAADNADIGSMAYVTTSAVRGAWKSTVKASGTAQFLWGDNSEVNGYAAMASNQVPGNRVIFGDFKQCLMARWEGLDITVDPYTLARHGKVQIYLQELIDFAVRHPESFCVSTDSGAQ